MYSTSIGHSGQSSALALGRTSAWACISRALRSRLRWMRCSISPIYDWTLISRNLSFEACSCAVRTQFTSFGIIRNQVAFAAAVFQNLFGDRKSVVEGKSVSVRVDIGGCRIIKKKKKNK